MSFKSLKTFETIETFEIIILVLHFIDEETEIERISVVCLQLFTQLANKIRLNLGVFPLSGYIFSICFVSEFIFVEYRWGKVISEVYNLIFL